jgi:RNA polymerase sigma factor (sigma-70 family)
MPLLRLRSDEQLLALFRAGNDEAFGVLHDRYRQRLLAYVRQMLSALSRQDAEDVMQDVFVRAYGALRADAREMNVKAWLYRVAHNRCIDHLRRPVPPPSEVFEVSRKPVQDPTEVAQRREDLARLVEDIGRLPDQQRSALLMRELDGMSYADLAAALDVTVPAVKSLLVRARVGLVDSAEARDADCADIRADLVQSYDRGVKASGRARRHMRTCSSCREYRGALRGMQRSFAALSPVTLGPLALVAQVVGLGGGGAAAGGAGGGGAVAAGGSLVSAKVAAVVCTAAITAGGAVEASHIVADRAAPKPAAAAPAARPAPPRHAAPAPAMAVLDRALPHAGLRAGSLAPVSDRKPADGREAVSGTVPAIGGARGPVAPPADDWQRSGGTRAPDEIAAPAVDPASTPAAGDGELGSGAHPVTIGTDETGDAPAAPPTGTAAGAGDSHSDTDGSAGAPPPPAP